MAYILSNYCARGFCPGATSLYTWVGLRDWGENWGIFLEGMVVTCFWIEGYNFWGNYIFGKRLLHIRCEIRLEFSVRIFPPRNYESQASRWLGLADIISATS
jgi:hypothetical protein